MKDESKARIDSIIKQLLEIDAQLGQLRKSERDVRFYAAREMVDRVRWKLQDIESDALAAERAERGDCHA